MSIRITGMNSGMDTDAMVQELVKAYQEKGKSKTQTKTKHEWKQEIWTNLNKKIKSFSSKVSNLQYASSYNQKKTVSSDENRVSVIAGDNAVRGTQTIKVAAMAKSSYITSGVLQKLDAEGKATGEKLTADSTLSDLGITSENSTITINRNGESVKISANKDTTIGSFVKALQESGVDASFDEKNGRLFISAKESGAANNIEFDGDVTALQKLKLGTENGASVIAGQDAKIYLNGAEFTSSTNSFDINGMAINVKGLTDEESDEEITLTTDTDTDAIYNNIKSLIKEYTSLINELSKLYNADSAKGYNPLSDDEKDAMSDTEIEKWETKIKDSLLRRDNDVASVMNAMKNSSTKSYEVNGKSYSLSDFGIGTISYFISGDNEKSALHINGDEDDEHVSGEVNKLKQMITVDPDTVAGFFSKYMKDMADQFTKMTRSTTNRSYGNFFDDKKMKTDLTKYEKKITEWEEYVADIEDKYYKQFTNMEKQMASLNSTQSQLGSYFG